MLKLLLPLLLLAPAAAKLVGTEYVSPALQAKQRRQQSEGAELEAAAPALITNADGEALAPEALEESQNVFGGADVKLLNATAEGLSDDQVTEIEMLLALRDIVRLEAYLTSIMDQLGKRIYGDLENTLLINKFTQSYGMYETILAVLQKYRDNRPILEAKARYVSRAIDYSLTYIRKTDQRFMELIDSEGDEKVRQTNREVFLQVLENLQKETEAFTKTVLDDMAEMFRGMEDTHRNPLKSDLQKIHELVDASLNLVVLKKTTLQTKIVALLDLRRLVLDNPKYSAHLTKIDGDRIVLGRAGRLAGALVGLLCLALRAI